MRIALIPGSFDPFTNGHLDIVKRTLHFMDKVVIGIGVNDTKNSLFSATDRVEMIKNIFSGDERVEVQSYNCLTTDFANQVGAKFIVRGARAIKDFEYEYTIADVNRKLSGIETIILVSEPELSSISSSVVRELIKFRADISAFVPKEVNLFLSNKR